MATIFLPEHLLPTAADLDLLVGDGVDVAALLNALNDDNTTAALTALPPPPPAAGFAAAAATATPNPTRASSFGGAGASPASLAADLSSGATSPALSVGSSRGSSSGGSGSARAATHFGGGGGAAGAAVAGAGTVSYTSALALGILLSPAQRLPLKALYAFAARHAAALGLRDQPNWRRSVRNTLSKQRGFVRVDAAGAPAQPQARRCLWALAEPELPQPTRAFLASARSGRSAPARLAHVVAAADGTVWPYGQAPPAAPRPERQGQPQPGQPQYQQRPEFLHQQHQHHQQQHHHHQQHSEAAGPPALGSSLLGMLDLSRSQTLQQQLSSMLTRLAAQQPQPQHQHQPQPQPAAAAAAPRFDGGAHAALFASALPLDASMASLDYLGGDLDSLLNSGELDALL